MLHLNIKIPEHLEPVLRHMAHKANTTPAGLIEQTIPVWMGGQMHHLEDIANTWPLCDAEGVGSLNKHKSLVAFVKNPLALRCPNCIKIMKEQFANIDLES